MAVQQRQIDELSGGGARRAELKSIGSGGRGGADQFYLRTSRSEQFGGGLITESNPRGHRVDGRKLMRSSQQFTTKLAG